jgi:hypothetical protein
MSKRDWCNIPVRVRWQGSNQWQDLRVWLQEHVHDWDYDAAGADIEDLNRKTIWFARERDAVSFALRWS